MVELANGENPPSLPAILCLIAMRPERFVPSVLSIVRSPWPAMQSTGKTEFVRASASIADFINTMSHAGLTREPYSERGYLFGSGTTRRKSSQGYRDKPSSVSEHDPSQIPPSKQPEYFTDGDTKGSGTILSIVFSNNSRSETVSEACG
jgi:hypothetical protein